MTHFSLTKVQVAQVTADTALAHYVADVEGPLNGSPVHLRWQVGEVWVKRSGEWKCRYYQPTPLPIVADSSSGRSGRRNTT
jgi:ketosteroid isomerase-like protein